MDKRDRLKKVIAYLKVNMNIETQKDIAEMMGASNVTLSKAINGEEKYLTNTFLLRFCKKFPQINIEWLITGEGAMLKGGNMTQGGHHNVQSGRDSILSGNPNASVGTINYHGLSREDLIAMLEERFHHLQLKDGEIKAIFEENRILTNECRKLNSEKEDLIKRNHLLTDKLIALIEK